MMNRQVAVADSMANAGSTARTTIIPPCYSPLRASLSSHRQRGSLPLKKRRFLLDLSSSSNSYEYPLQPRWQSSMKTPSSSCSSSSKTLDSSLPYSPDSTTTTNNPLLALVAAASVSTEPSTTTSSLYSTSTPACVSHPTDYSKPYHYPYTLSAASSSSTSSSSCYNLIPEEVQEDVVQLEEENNNSLNKRQQQRGGRIHHPPLSSPLPGGCHGRTSRNNSYCRRQPCYNGSQYCKLHYQQYIGSGSKKDDQRAAVVVVERAQEQPSPCTTLHHRPPAKPHVVHHHHQDKRFTGLSKEQRCQATTTRGRACAYVSVNGTLYCHLHADYDTNPPPRRGGGGSSAKKEEQQPQVLPPPIMSASSPATQQQPPSSISSPPSVTSESSSSCNTTSSSVMPEAVAASATIATPTTTQRTKKKKRVVVNNSPYPLLCSVSSDQWYDKLVLISTGPLKNHTGRVKKWGNGWVTVQTSSEALLHNRRSVELLLLPDDYKGETIQAAVQEENAIGTPTQNDEMKSTAVQEDAALEKGTKKQEDAGKQGDDGCDKGASKQEKELKLGDLEKHEPPAVTETNNTVDGGGLLRCVSREADVPPPSTTTPAIVESNSDTTSLDDDAPKEESKVAAPTPPVMVESNNSSSTIPEKGEEAGRPDTKEKPAVAASEEKEEPIVSLPKEESLLPERQSTPEAQPEKELLQTTAADPTPVKQESYSQQQPQLVTPNSPRKVTAHKNDNSDGPPLVDCLLAAQEGRRTNTKFNMDLLFGTAALERSRRTVHKPTRYEDTAMLERKRSRMNSGTLESSSDDASSSDSVKRKRVDA